MLPSSDNLLTAEFPGSPVGLMCNLLEYPELTVITAYPAPVLAWIVNDARRGAVQTAYQVCVASSREKLERGESDVWDSGRVLSNQSAGVRYGGQRLKPGMTFFWRVRNWDRYGKPSPYSSPQQFTTACEEDPPAFANRYPLEKTEVAPERFIEKGDGNYFVDFGKAAFGTLRFTVTAPANAAPIEIQLGEVAVSADTMDTNPGGSRRYRKMAFPLKEGTHTYTICITPDPQNSRGAAVLIPEEIGEVMPFRYAELVGVPGDLDAAGIRQITLHYRFNENVSTFESSDKLLNAIWDLCKYSIKATTFLGVYVDGDRERIPYEADAYINQLGHYSVDREYSMARYSIDYLMTHTTWPAEWPMHLPIMVWADYLHTGDASYLERVYRDAAAKTLKALERKDGLIVVDKSRMTPGFLESIHFSGELKVLVDWPPCERDDTEICAVNTVANAFHYEALQVMGKIATVLGKNDDSQQWVKLSEQVKSAFNATFLSADTGVYVDGEGSTHCSIHSNLFPLAFGLVPVERTKEIASFIKSRGMACSVYGAQHLLDGLYKAGEAEGALALLTSTGERSWVHMIYDLGSTITLEAWDNKFKPNQDWNHAWGAAPANVIPRHLMGIEPIDAGFSRFRVHPQISLLTRATVTIPTIRGPVRLSVRRPEPHIWQASLTVPANTTAEVYVPSSCPTKVTEGGLLATNAPNVKFLRIEECYSVFEIPGGNYEFAVSE